MCRNALYSHMLVLKLNTALVSNAIDRLLITIKDLSYFRMLSYSLSIMLSIIIPVSVG